MSTKIIKVILFTVTLVVLGVALVKFNQVTLPEGAVPVVWDGEVLKTVDIGPDNLFSYDDRLRLEGAEVGTSSPPVIVSRPTNTGAKASEKNSAVSTKDPMVEENSGARHQRSDRACGAGVDRGRI